MKQKRLISLALALVLAFTTCFSGMVLAFADGVSYTYDAESATLTITGTGEIDDYGENTLSERPWHTYADSTEKIVISSGITKVGDYAFARFSSVSDVELPDGLLTIGTAAFCASDSLKEIHIPDSVTTVGSFAFGFNYSMELTDGFVCYCSSQSAAQEYCVKNYVQFDSPMVNNVGTAHIVKGAQQAMWSFVANTDGTLTFWSTGTKDTFGLIYDASNYVYSETYKTMKASAIATGDDVGSNVNFKITVTVEKGKRYYLSGRFMMADRYDGCDTGDDGVFGVAMSFTCTEHEYEKISETPATCSETGTITYKCVGCGAEKTEETPKLEHTLGEAVEENRTEPTCETAGGYDSVVYCTVCENQISRERVTIEALGHNYGEYVSDGNATCTEDGTKTATCSRCSSKDTVTDEGSALGHDYQESVVDPTCTLSGYTKHTCSRCQDTYNDNYVDPLGHVRSDEQIEDLEEADCVTAGSYDSVYYCTRCSEELERTTQIIPALGHNFEIAEFENGVADCNCTRCTETKSFEFMTKYNEKLAADDEWNVLDVNKDGYINAKDYVKILKDIQAKKATK